MSQEDSNIDLTSESEITRYCDRCGRDLDPRAGDHEFQEALRIKYRPGPGSLHIEEGSLVECVLCQDCTRKTLGQFLRISGPDVVPISRLAYPLDDDYLMELRELFGGDGDEDEKIH